MGRRSTPKARTSCRQVAPDTGIVRVESNHKMATSLDLKVHYAGISAYENECASLPNAPTPLCRLAGVCTCVLIDDGLELTSKSHKRVHKRANGEH